MHRQAGVIAGGDALAQDVDRVGEVDALDRAARSHHVFDGDGFEVEQVHQDVAVCLRDVLARLQHHAA